MIWEKIKLVGWGAMFVLLGINTFVAYERNQTNRELTGSVKTFRAVLERLEEKP